MKLLFDQNLSPRLVGRIGDIFPGSSHVSFHALAAVDDIVVWEFAKAHGFTHVTKDADFSDLSALRGSPPKVLRLRIGNCTTAQVESLLRKHQQAIELFETDVDANVLELR